MASTAKMTSNACARQRTVNVTKTTIARANVLPLLVPVIGEVRLGNGVETLQIVSNTIDTLSIA